MVVDFLRSPRVGHTHVKRQILNSVSHKDKPIVNQELNEVFTLENKERKSLQGYEHFITSVNRWEKKYPVLRKYKARRNICLFHLYGLPCRSTEMHLYDELD